MPFLPQWIRDCACLSAALTVMTAFTAAAAEVYPARPIRVMVPFSPGGGTDILARIMSVKMTELLGQNYVIDNRPGASGQIGTEIVARAAPDGYTILHVDTSLVSNPSIYKNMRYDAVRDFAPISLHASGPVVLIVHPSAPAKTLQELIALAKARPGELNVAGGDHGAATALGMELFKSLTHLELVHIPFKGSGAVTPAVLSGQVTMGFAGPSSAKPLVAAGRLRALAITGEKRSMALPEVPTFDESGVKGVDAWTYWGALAPAGTPRPIINILNTAMTKVLAMPDIRLRLNDLTYDPIGGSPEDFAANIKSELAKWARVTRGKHYD
jgi:tripartite-type tricarboxylate transporter receptor subunit TctC